MSMQEFWRDDPNLFWAYRFSYYEKSKLRQQEDNIRAWLNGAYVYEAVTVALSNAFGRKRITYSKAPYGHENTSQIHKQKEIETQLKARIMQVQKVFKVKNE